MSTLQFGISTHLYHDQRLGRDHVVEIAAHGFETVEIFANRPHLDLADEPAMAELVESLRDAGLRPHSVHAPDRRVARERRVGSAALDCERRRAARARTRWKRSNSRSGSRTGSAHRSSSCTWACPTSQQPRPDDNRPDAARRSVEALADVAAPLGVRLALEVIPNRLSTAEQLVRLIEEDLELPDLGVCFDFGHAQLAGDLLDAIETLSGHVVTTHVHDNRGRTDDHLLPFEGRIDWDAA